VILNTFALTSLFIGIISLIMMLTAGISAFHYYRRWKKSEAPDERAWAENRLYLVFLLAFTALLLRVVSWPLFYITLEGLVPLVPGAMCIFGVTRVAPLFTLFLEILKPVTFFLIGAWLILHRLDLSLKTHPLMRRSLVLLFFVSALVCVEALAELIFVFTFSPPGIPVSCCTAIADVEMPAIPLVPKWILGPQYQPILVTLYHGLNLGLAGFIGLAVWKRWCKKESWRRRLLLSFLAMTALINGVVGYLALKESIGPRLMNLPDHHCIYCLLQYRTASIAIVTLFIVGTFCALWALFLDLTGRTTGEGEIMLSRFVKNLLLWALCSLLGSWALITVLASWTTQ
jgi:hypothetical protein